MKGAFDPVIRDKELDADGVAADVLFADADAITGMASPPFGAGLFAGAIEDPELAFAGAHAHNRFLAEMCSHAPHRRGGIALVPITHDVTRAVAEIEWVADQPGIRGIMIPTMWRGRAPYNDAGVRPGVGGVRRGRAARPHPLGRGAHGGVRRAHRDLPGRGGLVGGAAGLAPAVQRGLRAVPGAQVRRHRGRGLLGARHDVEVGPVHGGRPHHQEDGRAAEGQDLQAPLGLLRHQHLHRGVDHVQRGDPAALRHRDRRGDVGDRLPPSRGHLASHRGEADLGLRRGAGGRHRRHAGAHRGQGVRLRPRRP